MPCLTASSSPWGRGTGLPGAATAGRSGPLATAARARCSALATRRAVAARSLPAPPSRSRRSPVCRYCTSS
ncbi:MAG: hypothetical protein RLZZ584_2702 [Pseudomonadota bacterium]